MTETIVHLVRHGEVHNPGKILYGRLPGYRLSERGEQMARLTGEALAERDIAKVVASPLLRAQQTAKPIAEPHGLEIETDDRLTEALNHFEGHRIGHGEASFTNPKNWKYFVNPFRPSWGERYRDQVDRVMAAVLDTPPRGTRQCSCCTNCQFGSRAASPSTSRCCTTRASVNAVSHP